jgi:tetratricopeptide (TPR) repeat protein
VFKIVKRYFGEFIKFKAMAITKIDQQLIEKYLDKRLSDIEQLTFNQRLSDTEFLHEVKLYEQAVKGVYASGDNKLKGILQEEEAKLREPPQFEKPKLRISFLRWAVAASFLLLVSIGTWYLLEKIKEPKEVYATYFKPYQNLSKPTLRDDSFKNDIQKAFALYDNGDYKAAINYFEKISSSVQLSNDLVLLQYVTFIQANAYLSNQQIEKAIPLLERVSQDTQSKWHQHGEWYLALALSKNQTDKATFLFSKIKNEEGHPYQKSAIEVLTR